MNIGQLAKLTGCSIQSIRFYEKHELLQSVRRSENNYRVYGKDDLEQLAFIKQCRCLDMSIAEIKFLLQSKQDPQQSCSTINQMIDSHIDMVTRRIDQLIQLKANLSDIASACNNQQKVKDCGVLSQLASSSQSDGYQHKKSQA